MLVLVISSYILPPSQHVGMTLSPTYLTAPVAEKKTDVANPLIQEELDYSLDRHNVEDEGYEMVVAFANGQRLQIEPDDYIPVRNVGTWKDHDHQETVIVLDSLGRTIIATCRDDSLMTGFRPDSLGTYI